MGVSDGVHRNKAKRWCLQGNRRLEPGPSTLILGAGNSWAFSWLPMISDGTGRSWYHLFNGWDPWHPSDKELLYNAFILHQSFDQNPFNAAFYLGAGTAVKQQLQTSNIREGLPGANRMEFPLCAVRITVKGRCYPTAFCLFVLTTVSSRGKTLKLPRGGQNPPCSWTFDLS